MLLRALRFGSGGVDVRGHVVGFGFPVVEQLRLPDELTAPRSDDVNPDDRPLLTLRNGLEDLITPDVRSST
jgi:hypothetical protein